MTQEQRTKWAAEWRAIATEAGIPQADLRARAEAVLRREGKLENAPAEAWMEAARTVAAELAQEATEAVAEAEEKKAAAEREAERAQDLDVVRAARKSGFVALPLAGDELSKAQLGAIVSWKLQPTTDVRFLRECVQRAGLPESMIPDLPSAEQRLARAMAPLSERRALVRPLAAEMGVNQRPGAAPRRRRGGKALVKEHVVNNGQDLEHETEVKAVVRRRGGVAQLEITPPDDYRAAGIAQRFTDAALTYDSDQISNWLVCCVDALCGVRTRARGGTYWIPPQHYATWCTLMGVVEEHGHVIDEIPCLRAAKAVTTLARAIEREARSLAEQVQAKVAATVEEVEKARKAGQEDDKGMGIRALGSQAADLSKARGRLAEYEEALGCSLDRVRDALSLAEVAVAEAAMARKAAADEAAGKWAGVTSAVEAAAKALAGLAA